MAASEEKPFETRLFDDGDDEETLIYKNLLQSLITQSKSPSVVATDIDSWVAQNANQKFNALKSRDPPFRLDGGEEEWLSMRLLGPNPSKDINSLFEAIAVICSAFPPSSPAQDRLIELVQSLKDQPHHDVPSVSPKENDSGTYDFTETTTLWQFGTDNVRYLMMNFNSEAEELAYPFSDVETPGSEVQLRWRNLQAFVARLTTSSLIDCGDLCALSNILPSSSAYPDLGERKVGGPKRIEGDLLAGSHWISSEQACRWVYEQCKATEAKKGRFYDLWNMKTWNELKGQLSYIMGDERFSTESRQLAKSLREKMDSQEIES
ncbi:unnamed protein product [Clonostachys rosea]|uniref:WHIM1 domain-containing protein n=1 Tax=Bionectria ochroleuca TaxID=29856 RepID=A0ABY6U5N2_BIOOC|nr:unnamed protein product [Clonostachys rosea]